MMFVDPNNSFTPESSLLSSYTINIYLALCAYEKTELCGSRSYDVVLYTLRIFFYGQSLCLWAGVHYVMKSGCGK